MTTNSDGYKPTAKQRKLIEVMSNPLNRHMNITELCQEAGVSREAYYNLMKKPEFVEYYKKVQHELIKGAVARVLSATIDYAVSDPKCHQDRKMLLEMGDMYTPQVKQVVTGEDGGPLQVVFSEKMKPR